VTRLVPIDEIDPRACAALEGLVFDIDDTVTRAGRLERAAFDEMWRLSEAGLRLVAVTGRPLGWCDVIARHWPIDIAVAENGACWAHASGAHVSWGMFDGEAARASQRVLLDRVIAAVAHEMPEVALAEDQWARRCDIAFDVGEAKRVEGAELERLLGIIRAEGARVVVSSVHAHVIAGDYDKPRGVVRAVREVLGAGSDVAADPARWLFVGDSANDAAAFEWFPLSAGVANVRAWLDRLPLAPAYVARSDRGAGFAEIAQVVLERRARSGA